MTQAENIELLGRRIPVVDPEKPHKAGYTEQTFHPSFPKSIVSQALEKTASFSHEVAKITLVMCLVISLSTYWASTNSSSPKVMTTDSTGNHPVESTTAIPTLIPPLPTTGPNCKIGQDVFIAPGDPAPISGWICSPNGQFIQSK